MVMPLAILMVEDSESDAQLIVHMLEKAGYEIIFERVQSAGRMRAALKKRRWDVVISECNLLNFDGRAALKLLIKTRPDIPCIIVSNGVNEESALTMMKAGARDYLIKSNLTRLAPVVARELEQAQDRHERAQALQALRESEELFRLAFENANIGMCLMDTEGRYVKVNRQFCKMCGFSQTEIEGMTVNDLTHPDYLNVGPSFIKRAASGEMDYVEFEKQYIHKQGRLVWGRVSSSLVRDAAGAPLYFISHVQDITDRKQAEDQLRQLSLAVEQNPSSIIITDMDGKIEYVNPKFTALTGYTLEEVRMQNPRILQSGQTLTMVYKDLWQTILSGKEWRGEFLNRKKNGELYWEFASISALTDAKGNVTHFVAVKEDITSRKEDEENIRRLNAELEKLAMTDYMTNLYNRRYFMQRSAEEFKRARRSGQPLSLLMMDINDFKLVNDTHGHEAGDAALKQVAAVLKSNLREIDLLGRLGGDEFAVLLPNTQLKDALLSAERIRRALADQTVQVSDASLIITVSIGAAVCTNEMESMDDILRNADGAMYQAKRNGN